MIKLLLLTTLLTLNPLNADTSKMSEEDLMKQLLKITEQNKKETHKLVALKKKSKDIRQYGKNVDKLEKTVSTLASTLGADE